MLLPAFVQDIGLPPLLDPPRAMAVVVDEWLTPMLDSPRADDRGNTLVEGGLMSLVPG